MRLGTAVLECRTRFEFGTRARTFLLRSHRFFKSRHINVKATLATDISRQIDGETVGVRELEGSFTVETLGIPFKRGIQNVHAFFQRLAEALFLQLQHRFYALFGLHDFRKSIPHHLGEIVNQLIEKGLLLPDFIAVTHGTTGDAAQYITTTGVVRNDAIANQE